MRKIFLLYFIFLIPNSSSFADENEIKVLLRFDDVSPKSDAELENKLFESIREVGGQLLIGVIPFTGLDNCNKLSERTTSIVEFEESRETYIRQYSEQKILEIALHGCNHKFDQHKTELSGLSVNSQRNLLKYGRKYLQTTFSQPIRFFIPTGNQYNLNTIAALGAEEFTGLSASIGNTLDSSSSVSMIPGTTYPQNLRKKLTRAIAKNSAGGYVIITMHAYDFVESKTDLPQFRIGLKDGFQISIEDLKNDILWIKQHKQLNLARWDEFDTHNFPATRMEANSQWRKTPMTKHALLPATFNSNPAYWVYYTEDHAEAGISDQVLQATLLYSSAFFASLFFAIFFRIFVMKTSMKNVQKLIGLPLSALVLLLVYSYFNGFYLKSALLTTGLLGVLVGFSTLFLMRRTSSG